MNRTPRVFFFFDNFESFGTLKPYTHNKPFVMNDIAYVINSE